MERRSVLESIDNQVGVGYGVIGDWDWDWGNHLGTPVWGVLAACAVLGFDGHQLGDLAGDDGFGRKGRD